MKKYFYIFILIVLALGAYFTFGHLSEGSRAGTITKLSRKGILFKTYEGELNTQMYIDESSSASGIGLRMWEFSLINNDSLYTVLSQAMLDGHRVELKYKQRFFKLPWLGDSEYIVTDINLKK
jgi:hypothetical protein